MRRRPSARLLVLEPSGRVLLFRFVHRDGPLAGEDFWATPGGSLRPGETFPAAATRELAEETGIHTNVLGREVGRSEFVLRLPGGERVLADERYFLVAAADTSLSFDGHTALERKVIAGHKWWTRDELARTEETVWPENLLQLLGRAFGPAGAERQDPLREAPHTLG